MARGTDSGRDPRRQVNRERLNPYLNAFDSQESQLDESTPDFVDRAMFHYNNGYEHSALPPERGMLRPGQIPRFEGLA